MEDKESLLNEMRILQKKLDKLLDDNDKNESNLKPKKIVEKNSFGEQSFQFQTTHDFIRKLVNNADNLKIKVPATDNEFQKWCLHIDRLLRLDEVTEIQILKVIDFAVTDSFWKTNILSTRKLREKFNTLYGQMAQKATPPKAKAKQANFSQREEWDFNSIEQKARAQMLNNYSKPKSRQSDHKQREWDFEKIDKLILEKM